MVSLYYKKNKIGLKAYSMNYHLACRTEHAIHVCRLENACSEIQANTQRVAGKNKQEKAAIKANKESCCMLNKAFMTSSFCLGQTVHFVSVLQ